MAAAGGGLHLVVMQHGLWGQPVNMKYLEELLVTHIENQGLSDHVEVINSDVNEKERTYEGVDACGDRLTCLIIKTLNKHAEQGRPVTHLSLIGYSMGGLITRYVTGKLYTLGVVSTTAEQPDPAVPISRPAQPTTAPTTSNGGAADCPPLAAPPVQPVNFITVATPHLGTWMMPTTFWGRTFNSFVPRVTARAGTHFMLLDKHAFDRPLLVNMADPALPFMQGLACFKHHMLLANTLHDRSVPYCTAAILEHNPYEDQDSVAIHPEYPSIVRPVPRQLRSFRSNCSRSATARSPRSPRDAQSPGLPPSRDEGDVPVGGQQPPEGDADEAQPVPFTGWRKGWGVRVVFLLLLPLTFPLVVTGIAYMLMVGRRQWAAVTGRTFDYDWVLKATSTPPQAPSQHTTTTAITTTATAISSNQSQEMAAEQPAASRSASTSLVVPRAPGAGGGGQEAPDAVKHGLLATFTGKVMSVPQPELHDVSVRQSAELPRSSKQRRRSLAAAEDIDVTIDGGAKELHVRQGLVDTPGSEREAQLWMMNHLNKLPWVKVDVDTRHYHAHAAIMVRIPKRFADNADCLRYLVDNMVLKVA